MTSHDRSLKSFFLLGLMLMLGVPPGIHAGTTTGIYLSEIAWNGSSKSSVDEWLEITNESDATIDISGWSLVGAASSQGTVVLPDGSSVAPRQSFIVGNYPAASGQSVLAQEPNYVTSSISLSNSALKIILKDKNGIIIDMAGNGGTPFADGSKDGKIISMIRLSSVLDGTVSSSWKAAETSSGFDADILDLGTPGTPDGMKEVSTGNSNQITENNSNASASTTSVPSSPSTTSSDSTTESTMNNSQVSEINGDAATTSPSNEVLTDTTTSPVNETSSVSDSTSTTVPVVTTETNSSTVSSTPSSSTQTSATTQTTTEQSAVSSSAVTTETDISNQTTGNNGSATTVPSTETGSTDTTPPSNTEPSTTEVPESTSSITTTDSAASPIVSTTPTTETPSSSVTPTSPSSSSTTQETTSLTATQTETKHYGLRELLINEFISDPVSEEKEWVEILNPGNISIPGDGWKIQEGGGKTYPLPTGDIASNGYTVVEISSSSLNNDGDTIRLLAPDATVIDELTYGTDSIPAVSDPNAVARKMDGTFSLTTTPTKGIENSITVPPTTSTSSTSSSTSSEKSASTSTSTSSTTNSTTTSSTSKTSSPTTTSSSISSTPTSSGSTTSISVMTYPKGSLLINEFVSDPVKGEKEWIEILNPRTLSISLDGWKVQDASKHSVALGPDSVSANGFFILTLSSSILNNDTDIIELLDPAGNIIDTVIYGTKTVPTTKDPNSIGRQSNGTFVVTTTPTPGSVNLFSEDPDASDEKASSSTTGTTQNTTETSQQTSTKTNSDQTVTIESSMNSAPEDTSSNQFITFSEVYPNTNGNDATEEFIELHNTGTDTISLVGWSIKDAGGKTFTIKNSLSIEPDDYLVFTRPTTGITLNNTGTETLSLFNSQSLLIDTCTYENAPAGLSFALFEDAWQWTTKITPSQPNDLQKPDVATPRKTLSVASAKSVKTVPILDTDIESVRSLKPDTRVRLHGIVAVVPGTFSDQIFYLAGSGIQIYRSDKNFPPMSVGNTIEMIGTLSSYRGETRIKMEKNDQIIVLETSSAPPLPHEITSIGENVEGWLVRINGQIVNQKKDRITLETVGTQFEVRAKDPTGLNFSAFEIGSQMQIDGIVGQTDDAYYVMPRSDTDVTVLSAPSTTPIDTSSTGKATATNHNNIYALVLIGSAILVIGGRAGFLAYKKKYPLSYEKPTISLPSSGRI